MLNRRFLRIKVMQALYAFFQHEKADAKQFEKDLFRNLDKIYDLYLTILAFLADLHHVALMTIEENRNKRLPTREDLSPNMRFVENYILKGLAESKPLQDQLDKRRISWQNDADVVRRIFAEVKQGALYRDYMSSSNTSAVADRDFVIGLITSHLSDNEVLASLFEEKNMHWADDAFVAFNSVIRNLEDTKATFELQPLLRDEQDDLEFMSILFNKTILYKPQLDEIISAHTENWEIERIANMDVLLMEMALAEVLYLPSIPVKASLNEYIDISKEYSTPSSKNFVNGVLDKAIGELKKAGKIVKTGRGLRED